MISLSLCHCKIYLTPLSVLYHYKNRMRSNVEYCCDICTEVTYSLLYSFDRIQYRIPGLMHLKAHFLIKLTTQSYRSPYRYIHDKCSGKLHTLMPKAQSFRPKIRLCHIDSVELHSFPTTWKILLGTLQSYLLQF